ncbi:MAG TPA: hypothetical protein VK389_08730, partial [Thermoanaerobaculia bacterium]|nr:hypothetical protein [Thermoanaerobaculia bacterium]
MGDSDRARFISPTSADEADSLARSLGWLSGARIVVFALILLSAVLVQAGSGAVAGISFLYRLLAGAVALSLVHWTAGRFLSPRIDAWVQVLGDLALVTLLVYSTGGPDSVFTFLYLVVIGTAGFLLYRVGAILTASIAAILYGSMVELV